MNPAQKEEPAAIPKRKLLNEGSAEDWRLSKRFRFWDLLLRMSYRLPFGGRLILIVSGVGVEGVGSLECPQGGWRQLILSRQQLSQCYLYQDKRSAIFFC